MSDEVFYTRKGVSVSPTLARFGDSSYPIASIGGVHLKRNATLFFVVAGLIFLTIALACQAAGEGAAASITGLLGFFGLARAFQPHKLILRTGSGDQVAYQSNRLKVVNEVKNAIEQAVGLSAGKSEYPPRAGFAPISNPISRK